MVYTWYIPTIYLVGVPDAGHGMYDSEYIMILVLRLFTQLALASSIMMTITSQYILVCTSV